MGRDPDRKNRKSSRTRDNLRKPKSSSQKHIQPPKRSLSHKEKRPHPLIPPRKIDLTSTDPRVLRQLPRALDTVIIGVLQLPDKLAKQFSSPLEPLKLNWDNTMRRIEYYATEIVRNKVGTKISILVWNVHKNNPKERARQIRACLATSHCVLIHGLLDGPLQKELTSRVRELPQAFTRSLKFFCYGKQAVKFVFYSFDLFDPTTTTEKFGTTKLVNVLRECVQQKKSKTLFKCKVWSGKWGTGLSKPDAQNEILGTGGSLRNYVGFLLKTLLHSNPTPQELWAKLCRERFKRLDPEALDPKKHFQEEFQHVMTNGKPTSLKDLQKQFKEFQEKRCTDFEKLFHHARPTNRGVSKSEIREEYLENEKMRKMFKDLQEKQDEIIQRYLLKLAFKQLAVAKKQKSAQLVFDHVKKCILQVKEYNPSLLNSALQKWREEAKYHLSTASHQFMNPYKILTNKAQMVLNRFNFPMKFIVIVTNENLDSSLPNYLTQQSNTTDQPKSFDLNSILDPTSAVAKSEWYGEFSPQSDYPEFLPFRENDGSSTVFIRCHACCFDDYAKILLSLATEVQGKNWDFTQNQRQLMKLVKKRQFASLKEIQKKTTFSLFLSADKTSNLISKPLQLENEGLTKGIEHQANELQRKQQQVFSYADKNAILKKNIQSKEQRLNGAKYFYPPPPQFEKQVEKKPEPLTQINLHHVSEEAIQKSMTPLDGSFPKERRFIPTPAPRPRARIYEYGQGLETPQVYVCYRQEDHQIQRTIFTQEEYDKLPDDLLRPICKHCRKEKCLTEKERCLVAKALEGIKGVDVQGLQSHKEKDYCQCLKAQFSQAHRTGAKGAGKYAELFIKDQGLRGWVMKEWQSFAQAHRQGDVRRSTESLYSILDTDLIKDKMLERIGEDQLKSLDFECMWNFKYLIDNGKLSMDDVVKRFEDRLFKDRLFKDRLDCEEHRMGLIVLLLSFLGLSRDQSPKDGDQPNIEFINVALRTIKETDHHDFAKQWISDSTNNYKVNKTLLMEYLGEEGVLDDEGNLKSVCKGFNLFAWYVLKNKLEKETLPLIFKGISSRETFEWMARSFRDDLDKETVQKGFSTCCLFNAYDTIQWMAKYFTIPSEIIRDGLLSWIPRSDLNTIKLMQQDLGKHLDDKFYEPAIAKLNEMDKTKAATYLHNMQQLHSSQDTTSLNLNLSDVSSFSDPSDPTPRTPSTDNDT